MCHIAVWQNAANYLITKSFYSWTWFLRLIYYIESVSLLVDIYHLPGHSQNYHQVTKDSGQLFQVVLGTVTRGPMIQISTSNHSSLHRAQVQPVRPSKTKTERVKDGIVWHQWNKCHLFNTRTKALLLRSTLLFQLLETFQQFLHFLSAAIFRLQQ